MNDVFNINEMSFEFSQECTKTKKESYNVGYDTENDDLYVFKKESYIGKYFYKDKQVFEISWFNSLVQREYSRHINSFDTLPFRFTFDAEVTGFHFLESDDRRKERANLAKTLNERFKKGCDLDIEFSDDDMATLSSYLNENRPTEFVFDSTGFSFTILISGNEKTVNDTELADMLKRKEITVRDVIGVQLSSKT